MPCAYYLWCQFKRIAMSLSQPQVSMLHQMISQKNRQLLHIPGSHRAILHIANFIELSTRRHLRFIGIQQC
ncbi:hypothetical protein A6P55_13925 [Pandoraea pnomenusa]|nr:hypothetical protein A6P55_13925 [Pandoraea pnomenusa]